MEFKILGVNLAKLQSIAAKNGVSGIFKLPQIGSVVVESEGLIGDVIHDRQHHGGVDQAVYVYCQKDYEWWREQEGLDIYHGFFGENITISDLSTSDVHIGARLVSETVTLEVTSPRTPCETLAARTDDRSFPKRFWKSLRTGFYCRVIAPGTISCGHVMQFKPYNGPHITIQEWIKNEPLNKMDAQMRHRFLSVPIHYKTRAQLLS